MNDAHLTAKLASSEELIITGQTVDRLFVFINVPKFVQDHVYSTVRFSYLDRSVCLVQIFVNQAQEFSVKGETGRSFLTRRNIHASYI